MHTIKPSEITPEPVYLSRRRFLKGAGALAAGAVLGAACGSPTPDPVPSVATTAIPRSLPPVSAGQDELGRPLTALEEIVNYTNYYEFTTSKTGVARLAQDLRTSPWSVEVKGLVRNPRTFDLDDLFRFTQEERIYRMRCVEGWSMVIPWVGFPLAQLLQRVEPLAEAQYVRLVTLLDPEQMPGVDVPILQWPYVEGLRLDEAMHDLTLLATGLYGETLLPQNGAPVRLVVPWKYGFKSIKSIVQIELVSEMPVSAWMAAAPREYGFFANVNPEVDHPRWSQATERTIGDDRRIETLPFNGYGEQVASLYAGMDLTRWF